MPRPYLLDTCAWLDAFTAPENLRPAVLSRLRAEERLWICSISLLEVARKEARGELTFGMPLEQWFREALPAGLVGVLEITPSIAHDATRLPAWSHKDPADQIIVATARARQMAIVTSDRKILDYPHVPSLASRRN